MTGPEDMKVFYEEGLQRLLTRYGFVSICRQCQVTRLLNSPLSDQGFNPSYSHPFVKWQTKIMLSKCWQGFICPLLNGQKLSP